MAGGSSRLCSPRRCSPATRRRSAGSTASWWAGCSAVVRSGSRCGPRPERSSTSDARRLIGETFNLGDEEQAALEDGSTDSEMSDLSRPENRFERSFGSLVEVYLPVRAVDGTKLL